MVIPLFVRLTEDNPFATTRGLSPRTGGQEWLYHGCPTAWKITNLLKLVDCLLLQAERSGYTTVCPPVRKITHSLKLVDYLLVQADRRGYTTVCPPLRKITHLLKLLDYLLVQAVKSGYTGLSCTEDNPPAKIGGLSLRTGGQAWLYHGITCMEDNTLAKHIQLHVTTDSVFFSPTTTSPLWCIFQEL